MADKKDIKRFKCINFGACAKADSGEIIEIDAIETLGGIPECPHCHQHTLEEIVKKPFPTKLVAGVVAGILVLGGIGFGVSSFSGGSEEPEGGGPLPQDTTIVATGDTVVTPTITYIEEMQIDGGNFTMKSGDTKQLTATIAPEKHDESLAWSSDKEDVATVDPSGLVTAKKAGTATILLTADKSAEQAQVTVKVIPVDNSPRQNLGWGIYEGPANGFGGTITVTSTHTIDLKKASGETVTVNRGDKIVGVKMENGRLRQGEIHFADGTRKYLSGL